MHQKQEAPKRGPHQSVNVHNAFLRGEFVEMIKKKQWILLPAKLVLTGAELRLSPLGVLPQRGRHPRSIIDYSFYHMNDETVLMAPPEAMQFCKARWRSLSAIVRSNPCLGPVYLSKVNIADGFYRKWVQAHRCSQSQSPVTDYRRTGTFDWFPVGAANGMEGIPTHFHFCHRNLAHCARLEAHSKPRALVSTAHQPQNRQAAGANVWYQGGGRSA
jgi:hypothetical protein